MRPLRPLGSRTSACQEVEEGSELLGPDATCRPRIFDAGGIDADGVARRGIDADPEEIAQTTKVAFGGQRLVEDAVLSDELCGHAQLEAEPTAADRVRATRGEVVDKEVGIGRGRPLRVAVVEVAGKAHPHWVGEHDATSRHVEVSAGCVGQLEPSELTGTQTMKGHQGGEGSLNGVTRIETCSQDLDIEGKRLAPLVAPGRNGGGGVDKDESPRLEDAEERSQCLGSKDPFVTSGRQRQEDILFGDLAQGVVSVCRPNADGRQHPTSVQPSRGLVRGRHRGVRALPLRWTSNHTPSSLAMDGGRSAVSRSNQDTIAGTRSSSSMSASASTINTRATPPPSPRLGSRSTVLARTQLRGAASSPSATRSPRRTRLVWVALQP